MKKCLLCYGQKLWLQHTAEDPALTGTSGHLGFHSREVRGSPRPSGRSLTLAWHCRAGPCEQANVMQGSFGRFLAKNFSLKALGFTTWSRELVRLRDAAKQDSQWCMFLVSQPGWVCCRIFSVLSRSCQCCLSCQENRWFGLQKNHCAVGTNHTQALLLTVTVPSIASRSYVH